MTRAALILTVVLTLALASLSFAQDDTITLVPVPVLDDELVVSVPSTWVRWDRENYDTDEAAHEALIALYTSVKPSADFSALQMPTNAVFVALDPDLTENRITSVRVEAYPFEDILAQPGVNLDQIGLLAEQEGLTPGGYMARRLFDTNGYSDVRDDGSAIQANGRDVYVGSDPQLPQNWVAVTYFDSIDTITFTTFSSTPTYLDDEPDLPETLLLSLRLPDEDLDPAAFSQFNDGEPFPERLVPGTPEPPTPEPTEAPTEAVEATQEAAATEAAATGCTVQTGTNVNMRSGPGVNFGASPTPMRPVDRFEVTGQATGTDGRVWYRLENDYWVRNDVVRASGSCDDLPEVDY